MAEIHPFFVVEQYSTVCICHALSIWAELRAAHIQDDFFILLISVFLEQALCDCASILVFSTRSSPAGSCRWRLEWQPQGGPVPRLCFPGRLKRVGPHVVQEDLLRIQAENSQVTSLEIQHATVGAWAMRPCTPPVWCAESGVRRGPCGAGVGNPRPPLSAPAQPGCFSCTQRCSPLPFPGRAAGGPRALGFWVLHGGCSGPASLTPAACRRCAPQLELLRTQDRDPGVRHGRPPALGFESHL